MKGPPEALHAMLPEGARGACRWPPGIHPHDPDGPDLYAVPAPARWTAAACPSRPVARLRRAHGHSLPDCRLQADLLGLQRQDDLPGALAPAVWRAWLAHGKAGRLGEMLAHKDLLSTALLLAVLAEGASDIALAYGPAPLRDRATAAAGRDGTPAPPPGSRSGSHRG